MPFTYTTLAGAVLGIGTSGASKQQQGQIPQQKTRPQIKKIQPMTASAKPALVLVHAHASTLEKKNVKDKGVGGDKAREGGAATASANNHCKGGAKKRHRQ